MGRKAVLILKSKTDVKTLFAIRKSWRDTDHGSMGVTDGDEDQEGRGDLRGGERFMVRSGQGAGWKEFEFFLHFCFQQKQIITS